MEFPPPGPPPGSIQDSPALILMQMKNGQDDKGSPILPPPTLPPTPHKLSHILSQSPPHQLGMHPLHPPLPPPSSFNFMHNYMMMNPPPPLPLNNRPRIPQLALQTVARPSSAPGSPQGLSSSLGISSNPPSTPTTPISSPKDRKVECKLKHCLLCERGQPPLLVKAPTWASIMRVVFYCLKFDMNEKQYFSLKTDVYNFMLAHWDKLCLNKKKSDNWHKQIQDMLSHSKNLFESGMDKYKQNGFWRLKTLTDPWTIQKDRSPRKSSDPPARDPSTPYGSSSDDEGSCDDSADPVPKRVKMSDENEPLTVEQEKMKLASEVSTLRLQLNSMSMLYNGLREEIKQKDESLQSQREKYDKLTEEFCVLQNYAQREVPVLKTLPPANNTSNLLNNIIQANASLSSNASYSSFPDGSTPSNHPLSFSPHEIRKIEELKKMEEAARAMNSGNLPHKIEDLRNFPYANLLPQKVEELRNSPRTPQGSPRDMMSRDPSPRTDSLVATSPREMVMRDGSPRPDMLRTSAGEMLRTSSGDMYARVEPQQPILRADAQQTLLRDRKRDSPRSSPRNSPRTHYTPYTAPGSPLANHNRELATNQAPATPPSYARDLSQLVPALNLNSPRDMLAQQQQQQQQHNYNSPRDVLLATSNLSLNSPRDLANAGNTQSTSNPSSYLSQPSTNSPRDLLSINNILNSNSSSREKLLDNPPNDSSSSDFSSRSAQPLPAPLPTPHIPLLRNLHNLHMMNTPSPPNSPSTSILSANINNMNLADSSESIPSNINNSNNNISPTNPNRLSPLHQILPQYIPKSRSPTHDHPSPPRSSSPNTTGSPLLHQLLYQQQQQQQQLLQQQQLQQIQQHYHLQLQQLQQLQNSALQNSNLHNPNLQQPQNPPNQQNH